VSGEGGTVESVVVTKTVRLLAPFVLTFGLFTTFHGTSSVGGGFQGGVVVASVVVTFAFAFGVGQTDAWLRSSRLRWLAVAGVYLVLLVAMGTLAVGGAVLEVTAVPLEKGAVYAVELVELGIATTVAATIVVLFFRLAAGSGAAADRQRRKP